MVEKEKEDDEEKYKQKNDEQGKKFRKDARRKSGIEILLKERSEVEVVNEILKVIYRFVVNMQGISGAEVARDKEDRAGMTGDDNGAIHTKDRKVYTKDRAVHVHNQDGVGSSVSFTTTGLVCLANRNGAAAVEGKNQNEAEGAAFATVVDSDLKNSSTGNQRTEPWMIRSGSTVHLPSMYSFFE